jgi:MFS family permease
MIDDESLPARHGSVLSPELVRLIVGQVCLHSSMAGTRMAAPLLALGLGHGKAAVGVLVALFALSQAFVVMPAGRFADRHGLKRPVRWCVLAACLGVVLAAVWPVYPMLCVAAILCGGAIGAGSVSLQRHVGRAAKHPAQLRQVFSWLSIAPAASNFVGPLMAGLAIDLAGFRTAFLLLATMPGLAWLLIRTARELPNEAPPAHESATAWSLLRDPTLRRLLLMNWMVSASWELHSFMVPVLGHERGLAASVIGTILGAFAVGATSIRLAMPLLGQHVQEWVMIAGATAVSGLLLVIYPFAPAPLAMGLCSMALGAAVGAVQPMVMSLLHQITPRHRHGEVIALRMLTINLSSVGTPLLLGAAGGLVGVSAVFWATGLIVGLGSPLALRLRGVSQDHAEP